MECDEVNAKPEIDDLEYVNVGEPDHMILTWLINDLECAATATQAILYRQEWEPLVPCPSTPGEYYEIMTIDNPIIPAENPFEIEDFEYSKNYCYMVRVLYSGGSDQHSVPRQEGPIYSGDEACWLVEPNPPGEPYSLCTDDEYGFNSKLVWGFTCNWEWLYLSGDASPDCTDESLYPPEDGDWYCRIVGQEPVCVNTGPCESCNLPLGVFPNDQKQIEFDFGEGNVETALCGFTDHCYYDATVTTKDKYFGCGNIETCSSYLSEESCIENKCLTSNFCRWQPLYPELG